MAILCVLLFGSRPASRISAQQSSPQTASHEAILVLRNGHLLRGEISRVDDRYQVSVDGGKIYVKPADVELLCRHLDEAYQWKRARLFSDDARGHLELALWCQQHGLLGRAAEELANGMALAPAHPMIPLVERRLEMSLRPQPQAAETAPKGSDEGPSLDELDRLVEQMPPGTMETYTQKVQPLLSNYCATAACHGPSTQTDFTLHRIPAHGPINRRLTQRNLHGTLQWIDRNDPAASPLLTVPIRPHGSATTAVFADHQSSQYAQIVAWVCRVAQGSQPGTGVSSVEQGTQAMPEEPSHETVPTVYAAPIAADGVDVRIPDRDPLVQHASGPNCSVDFKSVDPGANPDFGGSQSKIQRGANLPQFVPSDPFDPEIFNRRFHR